MSILSVTLKKPSKSENRNNETSLCETVYSKILLGSVLIWVGDNWYFTDLGDCA